MIVIMGVLVTMALAMDTILVFLSLRDLQRGADSASLAGTALFRTYPGKTNAQKLESWKNVKRAVLLALSSNRLFGLSNTARADLDAKVLRFNSTGVGTMATLRDDVEYSSTGGTSNKFKYAVVRGVFCYDDAGGGNFVRRWYSLEKYGGYCIANAVWVYLDVTDMDTRFKRFLGVDLVPSIKIRANSYIDNLWSCGEPLCANLGTPDPIPNIYSPYALQPTVPCP